MADYNVKLKVDTSQHDRAMEKSAGQVNYYAKRVMGAKDKIMGLTRAIPALALAVGGATVAFKGLVSVLKSTDSGFDHVYRTMAVGNTVLDQFKTHLSTANFDGFVRGLERIAESARDAYDAIGDMDAFNLESAIPLADWEREVAGLREKIRNKNLSPAEREQAKTELAGKTTEYENIMNNRMTYTIQSFVDSFRAKFGGILSASELQKNGILPQGYDESKLIERVIRTLRDKSIPGAGGFNWQVAIQEIEDYFKAQQQLIETQYAGQIQFAKMSGNAQNIYKAENAQKKMRKGFEDLFAQIAIVKNIREDPDDDDNTNLTKAELLNILMSYLAIGREKSERLTRLNQLTGMDIKDPSTIDWDAIREAGLKEEAAEIALVDSNEKLAAEIARVYDQVGKLFDNKRQEGPYFRSTVNTANTNTAAGVQSYENQIEEYEYFMSIVNQSAESLKGAFTSISGGVLSVAGSVNSLGQVLGEVFDSEEVTEFFDSLQQGLNILSSIFSVYESIASVIEMVNTMKETSIALSNAQSAADTIATTTALAKTSADSGAAIAGATKSGAGIPFPWNLVAIAAGIAAVMGALSLIGKFADGGIVGGNSAVGDNMIARVNSGEMILNKRQQAHLFNLLDGAGTSIGNNSSTGNVTFRISGGDLVGVLNNQSKKKSRVL